LVAPALASSLRMRILLPSAPGNDAIRPRSWLRRARHPDAGRLARSLGIVKPRGRSSSQTDILRSRCNTPVHRVHHIVDGHCRDIIYSTSPPWNRTPEASPKL
jgi:hypothetical protein